MKRQTGITLIALVITIIVLLILAGVSISAITGENGIVTKAKLAKESTRAAEIQEQINLVLAENALQEETDREYITKEEMIEKLKKAGTLTTEEVNELETSDKITIGEKEVDFSKLPDGTIMFTIKEIVYIESNRYELHDVTYKADIGMTWIEWVASDYNTSGYITSENKAVQDSSYKYYLSERDNSGPMVYGQDEIKADFLYYWWEVGLGGVRRRRRIIERA